MLSSDSLCHKRVFQSSFVPLVGNAFCETWEDSFGIGSNTAGDRGGRGVGQYGGRQYHVVSG